MKKFGRHQRRKNQFRATSRFGLNSRYSLSIRGVIGKGQMNQDVAIQTDHCRPNISSANSSWEMTGVNTRWP